MYKTMLKRPSWHLTCRASALSFPLSLCCWHMPCELTYAIYSPAGKQHLQLSWASRHILFTASLG